MSRPTVKFGDDTAIKTEPPLSKALQDDANRIEYATDDSGRRIGVKKLKAIDLFDISLAMGDGATNQVALNQAMLVSSVVELGGERVSKPRTLAEIRALITRLDLHGYQAVGEAIKKFDAVGTSDEAVKNS